MKTTPLCEEHQKLGAKMIEFGGWLMPVYYTNVIDEHITTRTKAALFDICHMGEIEIRGKDSFRLINWLITNDLKNLPPNKAFYTSMCNEKGGIIDDLFVYCFSKERYMLVVNASTKDKDMVWIKSHSRGFDVDIHDRTGSLAKLDLQGPNSEKILQKMTTSDLSVLKRFHFIESSVSSAKAIISRTGYTAEDGFELYFSADKAVKIWNLLLEAGKPFGLKPAGLGARDTLRIEACYPLYGHEISEEITPYEAAIDFVVKLDKEFIGKKALESLKPTRKLAAFEMVDYSIPRSGYEIFKGSSRIGIVTSGTMSPTLKKGIGLGLINIQHINLGNEIHIKIREKLYKAKIVEKPFYSYKGGV